MQYVVENTIVVAKEKNQDFYEFESDDDQSPAYSIESEAMEYLSGLNVYTNIQK